MSPQTFLCMSPEHMCGKGSSGYREHESSASIDDSLIALHNRPSIDPVALRVPASWGSLKPSLPPPQHGFRFNVHTLFYFQSLMSVLFSCELSYEFERFVIFYQVFLYVFQRWIFLFLWLLFFSFLCIFLKIYL